MAAKKSTNDGRPKLRTSHRGAALGKAAPKAKKPAAKRPAKPTAKRPSPAAPPSIRRDLAPARVKRPKAPTPLGTESTASEPARQMAIDIAGAALEKKAVGLEILDVAGRVDYADFLVLMTGRSDRQVAALSQGIEEALRQKGKRPLSVEGMPHASWVVMDFGDVVVHVFQEDARNMYDLDGLWMDARRVPVADPQPSK